jgi:acyl carrier protein
MAISSDSLRTYLRDRMGLDVDSVSDDTPLFSSSLLDSFSMVDLIMFIENEGGFRMSPTDVNLDNLDSIDRILKFVEVRAGG